MIVYKSNSNSTSILIPEWEHVGAVLLSWPHKDSDWAYMLDEVTQCFEHLALTILNHSNLIIVTPSKEIIPQSVTRFEGEKLRIVIIPTNDTWARDFGPLSLKNNDGSYSLVDFGFNAWGLKFASCFDNKICRNLFAQKGIWAKDIKTVSRLGFILEGGAIESNGCGTILTTASCIFEANRNPELSNEEICQTLCDELGAKNIIVLQHGSLKGDDTDGHIDTLVRICDQNTIAYVQAPSDTSDEHFEELKLMEKELEEWAAKDHLQLIPLPMAEPVYDKDEHNFRLPATYANFLILNDAVLFPTYSSSKDKEAEKALRKCFPSHKIIGIECSALIRQHGSLHCVTMQIPSPLLKDK